MTIEHRLSMTRSHIRAAHFQLQLHIKDNIEDSRRMTSRSTKKNQNLNSSLVASLQRLRPELTRVLDNDHRIRLENLLRASETAPYQ
jgi:hypothetical protein